MRIEPSEAAAALRDETVNMPTEDSLAVGDPLMDRYRLVALIGEGRMSRVFKASDLDAATAAPSDEFVAVKVSTRPMNENDGSYSAISRGSANAL